MMKRICGIFLCLMMVFCLVPSTAFAAEEYTVTFVDVDMESTDSVSRYSVYLEEDVSEGSSVSEPENPTLQYGFKLLYWSLWGSTDAYDFSTPVTSDITLVAVYEYKIVRVTLIVDVSNEYFSHCEEGYGEGPYSLSVNQIISFYNDNEPYFTFLYWSLEPDGEEYDLDAIVEDDITLYGVYKDNSITDDSDNDSSDTTTSDTGSSASTEVSVTSSALVFSLEVPLSLPIYVDSYGNVDVATDCVLINKSGGAVVVSNVEVTAENSWEIVDFEEDFSSKKVGLQEFGMILNDDEVNVDGSISLGDSWTTLAANGGTLPIEYEVNVASQATAIELDIATLEFTIEWDET